MIAKKAPLRIRYTLSRLDELKYSKIGSLDLESTTVAGYERALRSVPHSREWKKITIPYSYGSQEDLYWFRTTVVLPIEAENREVYIEFIPKSDTLVFINDNPEAAINPLHERFQLTKKGIPGEKYDLAFEVYGGHYIPGCHPHQGEGIFFTNVYNAKDYPVSLRAANLLIRETELYNLYYDMYTLFNLAEQIDENSMRYQRILDGLYECCLLLGFQCTPSHLLERAGEARKRLTPLLSAKNGTTTPTIFAVGHAHIDFAWLWRIHETERKTARTFANMIRLSKEFPEFVFLQSQPAQAEIVKKEYPHIFKAMKEAFLRGQWEPNGAMWVEADCNLISGESFVRQFLEGRRSTEKNFGYRANVLWLPDVFGYSAAMPQILKLCGIEYFITSKINWNDTTSHPYDSFEWKGIDGTGIRTAFVTDCEGGYNGRITPENNKQSWDKLKHKDIQAHLIKPAGEGDGGGGTLRSDLEIAKRLGNLEGSPRVRWSSVRDGVEELFRKITKLPVWDGELYLQLHRGTFTTQGMVKKYNRIMERDLGICEALSVLSEMYTGTKYPHEILRELWRKVLTLQFHDILPGSSINEVYKDALEDYRTIENKLDSLISDSLSKLSCLFDCKGSSHSYLIYNGLGQQRTGLVRLPEWSQDSPSVQSTVNFEGEKEFYALVKCGPYGLRVFDPQAESTSTHSSFHIDGNVLHTPFHRISFDSGMGITSLIDRQNGYEFIPEGTRANDFQWGPDFPADWDGWDLDEDYRRTLTSLNNIEDMEIISHGSCFIIFRTRRKISNASEIVQDIVFSSRVPRIDFKTRVNWHEEHMILKVAFPTTFRSQQVYCDIQFGHLVRSTLENTLDEQAQFEICAHKWIYLHQGPYLAALMNDCKYGYDVLGGQMRLTLLRSPSAPDKEADRGVHDFTYSFMTGFGEEAHASVLWESRDLNMPLIATPLPASVSDSENEPEALDFFAFPDSKTIILENIKKAEKGNGYILRLYEAGGYHQSFRLLFAKSVKYIQECNLMEEPSGPKVAANIEMQIAPFEIKSLRIY